MTEHEMRNQRVRVRIELEDAEAGLVHLQVKAERYADSIESITRKLRDNAALKPSRNDSDVEAELKMRLSPEEFGLLKSSGDEMVKLIAELRQQRQTAYRLQEQDKAMSFAAR